MIVYFDTSALVATYQRDRCSDAAVLARRGASALATSFLAYAETIAALSASAREGYLTRRERDLLTSRFVADWSGFQRIRVDARTLPDTRRALAKHPLKGADAVHLACALLTARGCTAAGVAFMFACDDHALSTAAEAEGLSLAW
jgi:predicted nucleic acid-binding protein